VSQLTLSWLALLAAGACEIVWAVGLKLSDGFRNLTWAGITLAAIFASMGLMAYAFRTIPIGTGYAVWTGIGAAGTAIVGIYLFDEPRDWLRVASIAMIVAGVIGLKIGMLR
jgi:quaternary ammonium compound-resistance protein SugE